MKLIGLTGGVGMGKSTCAAVFKAKGIAVIDTDDVARQVVEPGRPALNAIADAFGSEFITSAGALDRSRMAALVFKDPSARMRLESMVHPLIREQWKAESRRWRNGGVALGVIVIPLLFETGAREEFDSVICVACSDAAQRRRLLSRNWTEEQIAQRISAQMPAGRKMDLSDHVIWTEGSRDLIAPQMNRILCSMGAAG